uniref:Uncharacterized protein n=1 Tax=Utricularia reniformis TaxID=192314 RepID=A0A1Y0B3V6_9LAMI|nr:hypothetical protein AEK19_MT1924 [Utricularia reniformis]ART32091.1 hypothetical protein AEK19_MT1924 [Utricularia reniformis]
MSPWRAPVRTNVGGRMSLVLSVRETEVLLVYYLYWDPEIFIHFKHSISNDIPLELI